MTPRPLLCPHCGSPVLPVDPGWTLPEIAVLLRVTPEYVETLSRHLALDLDPPSYRRLSDHPRLHRVWSARDVQRMQAALIRKRVKRVRHTADLTSRPDRRAPSKPRP